jgi:hypothetical protein
MEAGMKLFHLIMLASFALSACGTNVIVTPQVTTISTSSPAPAATETLIPEPTLPWPKSLDEIPAQLPGSFVDQEIIDAPNIKSQEDAIRVYLCAMDPRASVVTDRAKLKVGDKHSYFIGFASATVRGLPASQSYRWTRFVVRGDGAFVMATGQNRQMLDRMDWVDKDDGVTSYTAFESGVSVTDGFHTVIYRGGKWVAVVFDKTTGNLRAMIVHDEGEFVVATPEADYPIFDNAEDIMTPEKLPVVPIEDVFSGKFGDTVLRMYREGKIRQISPNAKPYPLEWGNELTEKRGTGPSLTMHMSQDERLFYKSTPPFTFMLAQTEFMGEKNVLVATIWLNKDGTVSVMPQTIPFSMFPKWQNSMKEVLQTDMAPLPVKFKDKQACMAIEGMSQNYCDWQTSVQDEWLALVKIWVETGVMPDGLSRYPLQMLSGTTTYFTQ